jgi:hypothetical protein
LHSPDFVGLHLFGKLAKEIERGAHKRRHAVNASRLGLVSKFVRRRFPACPVNATLIGHCDSSGSRKYVPGTQGYIPSSCQALVEDARQSLADDLNLREFHTMHCLQVQDE